jgi:hypothetical protein
MAKLKEKVTPAAENGKVLVAGLDIEPKHIPAEFQPDKTNDPEKRLTILYATLLIWLRHSPPQLNPILLSTWEAKEVFG